MDEKCKTATKKPPLPSPPVTADTDNCAPRLPPKPTREVAKVLFAYDAQNDDELSIKEGDIITVISKEIEDQGWWKGELNGKVGVFPDNFVELVKTAPPIEDLTLPPRLKKPERAVDKQIPAKAAANWNPILDELSKHSSLASKKAKAPDGPIKKAAAAPVAKPDVVPQEVVAVKDDCFVHHNNENDNEYVPSFANVDTSNKLTHLTANRAKGPRDRRPPSMLGVPKEFENGLCKENGNYTESKNNAANNSITAITAATTITTNSSNHNTNTSNQNAPIAQESPKSNTGQQQQQQQPVNQRPKPPPTLPKLDVPTILRRIDRLEGEFEKLSGLENVIRDMTKEMIELKEVILRSVEDKCCDCRRVMQSKEKRISAHE